MRENGLILILAWTPNAHSSALVNETIIFIVLVCHGRPHVARINEEKGIWPINQWCTVIHSPISMAGGQ